MAYYRLYHINSDGHFIGFKDFEADEDVHAIEKAAGLLSTSAAELWQQSRLVHSFNVGERATDSDRSINMEKHKLYDEASSVAAENGEVVVDGPDGVDVSLTPEAAIETSHRLLEEGLTAQGQQVQREYKG